MRALLFLIVLISALCPWSVLADTSMRGFHCSSPLPVHLIAYQNEVGGPARAYADGLVARGSCSRDRFSVTSVTDEKVQNVEWVIDWETYVVVEAVTSDSRVVYYLKKLGRKI